MKKNNQNGITLISLVISIIVMLILASVTISTSFTAYETTRVEKFKAQLRVLQEGVNSFESEFDSWQTEKSYEYKDLINEKNVLTEQRDYLALPENQSNVTNHYKYVEVLDLLADEKFTGVEPLDKNGNLPTAFYNKYNIDTFVSEKKEQAIKENKLNSSYNIPKTNYNTLKNNNSTIVNKLKNIYSNKFKITMDNSLTFYEFDSESIKYILGLSDIDMTVYIDFTNQFIFTIDDAVRLDGEKVYTIYEFNDVGNIYENDTKSATLNGKIRIEEIANYGTSKKIKLTLNTSSVVMNNSTNTYKIRKAYYKTKIRNHWDEVDNLRECKYSEDGKSVTFIVYESGEYNFRIEDVSGSYTDKMEQFTKFNIRNSSREDDSSYDLITDGNGYKIILCNAPVITSDMVPVKWVYEESDKKNGYWVTCSTLDPEWYNYSEDKKMWANIMFLKDSKITSENLKIGQSIPENKMGSMFVWIPRFASVTSGTSTLGYNIQFLRDASNTTTFGTTANDTNLNIPSAFINNSSKEGSWDSELKGLWFAKYDTGVEDQGRNRINTSYTIDYDELYNFNYQKFYAVSKPYHVAWSNISFTNAFSHALMFYKRITNTTEGEEPNINSHMMKYSEYNVLRIITRDSKLGNPNIQSNNSNRYTAGSDGNNGFSIINSHQNQSSTNNMTGIFDVSGTIDVMLASVIYHNKINENNLLYNRNGENLFSEDQSLEVMKTYYYNFQNKYISIEYEAPNANISDKEGVHIRVGENRNLSENLAGLTIEDTLNLSTKIDPTKVNDYGNQGFRIVIANSPSASYDSLIYDSTSVLPQEDEPGFFIIDKNTKQVIKDANGNYVDKDGNPTFFSWEYLNTPQVHGKDANGNDIEYKDLFINNHVLKVNTISTLIKDNYGILNIPSSEDKVSESFRVNSIGDNGFKDCKNLYKVNISDSVTKVGKSAFEGCTSLLEVNLGKSVKSLDSKAFYGCTSLSQINFPESLEKIGGDEYNVQNLTSNTWNKYKNESGETFYGCTNLQAITISKNLKIIGVKSFYGCTELQDVIIDDGRTENEKGLIIGYSAFEGDENIQFLNFPENTGAIIQAKAFKGCSKLISVYNENNGILYIDRGIFADCSSLKTFENIPDNNKIMMEDISPNSVYTNCPGLFEGCTALESAYLYNFNVEFSDYTLGNNIFKDCTNLKDLILPSYAPNSSIGTGTFRECKALKEITISEDIIKINSKSFGSDSLVSPTDDPLHIIYKGTSDQWDNLINNSSDDWFTNCQIYVTTTDGLTTLYGYRDN